VSRAWLLVLVLTGCGCGSSSDEPAAGSGGVPVMSAAEVQRSRDACQAYVDQACACASTVAAAKAACDAARAIPESLRMALGVASTPGSKPEDVRHALRFVRSGVAECIEGTAKLPSLGCSGR
jgi:hypothetical protein